MKRRYKTGDWFRVPLGGETDGLGLIAHADRSRLFGYFFGLDAALAPDHAYLRALHPADAVLACHFGGGGLEDRRWPVVAASLRFDEAQWPVPKPDGSIRYLTAAQLEASLRAALGGRTTPAPPFAVYQVRPPLNATALRELQHGGRVQYSEPLDVCDMDTLAYFLRERSDVELRIHGKWPKGFDVRDIVRLRELQALALDCEPLRNADALAIFGSLRHLRLGPSPHPVPLRALADLTQLVTLRLTGPNAEVEILQRLLLLETLELFDTRPVPLASIASAASLRSLTLAHAPYDLRGLAALSQLETLELRDMLLESLPDLSANANLRSLYLRNIRGVRDLAALRGLPAIRELAIEGMYQLEVPDFQPLAQSERRPAVTVEIGSKTKSREVYRMLGTGRKR